jgi:hypothetical protein
VHLGSKGGRVNGRRLGYSQVANMIYLIRKGTMPAGYGLKRMVCNILANHARAIIARAMDRPARTAHRQLDGGGRPFAWADDAAARSGSVTGVAGP